MLCAGGYNKYFNCHSSTKILILVIIQQQSQNIDFNSPCFSMFARPPTYGACIIYIYVLGRLKIKPDSVRIRFLSCQIFFLPSTGFEPTPLIHCSTIRLALIPALDYIYSYNVNDCSITVYF